MVGADELAPQAGNLALLETTRWIRKEFTSRICAESSSDEPGVLSGLRQESAYQVAEFFYLLKARQFTSVAQLELLIQLHNDHLVDLSRDPLKMSRMGLSRERVLEAIFTADTLPRMLDIWADEPGTFDQSNLARLLATTMSAETCRTTLIAYDRAGLMMRRRSSSGVLLVKSDGRLETILSDCLTEAGARLKVNDA